MKYIFIFSTAITVLIACSQSNLNSIAYPAAVIVDAQTNFVMQGDTFRAQVIAANPAQWKDRVSFENTGVQITKSYWDNGILNIAIKADQVGLSKFSGNFKIKTIKGDTTLSFSSEFIVSKPTPVVKTKFLIKDIENPIEVAVTGTPPYFELTAADAEIKGDFGKYTITPHKTGPLSLHIKSKDGKTDYGTYEFEVFEKK